MTNQEIDAAITNLEIGSAFFTPDQAVGAQFTITDVTPDRVQIQLDSGNEMGIARQAFLSTNDFLRNNGHDLRRPCPIASNNDPDGSGPLCLATRAVNDNVRCINYIVPILAHIGAVSFSGARPNRCWYV
ncbi:MAG: hypothetical protein M1270_08280 [Gammaproteobacteria bacterium]|nr:hypothetical protein [Gammaproteobacteria bacterium]